MTAIVGPVAARKRIEYLDVLRGLALFGVLAVNMQVFAGEPLRQANWVDTAAQVLVDWLFRNKALTLLSFLFGVGFAIQIDRGRSFGFPVIAFQRRRLAALALFGLLHGVLVWRGDILLAYAMLGALLLLFRNCSQKALLFWASGIAGSLILLLSARYMIGAAIDAPVAEIDLAGAVHSISPTGGNTFLRSVAASWRLRITRFDDLVSAIPLLSLFLLGLWVGRSDVLRIEESRPILKRICAVCLPLGLILNGLDAILPLVHPITPFSDWFDNVLALAFPPILSAGYASGLAILYLNAEWRARLSALAPIGRMALSNYLGQSVVCTLFFAKPAFSGKSGPALDLALSLLLYTIQARASQWWLSRFPYGPVEWLWRRFSYGAFRPA